LTDDTRGVIDRRLLDGLARKGNWKGRLTGPHLINAGRGKLQVEDDILAALEDGTLASATLDVFETEPLPQDSPLWTHPRVTVTPHNAALSDPRAIVDLIARQIRRHEAGQAFEHVVDRLQGY
jgi:glyoxylate/hydroxypyruvate reductase A